MEAQGVRKVKVNAVVWWAWIENLEFGLTSLLSCSPLFQTADTGGVLGTLRVQPLGLQSLPSKLLGQ